MVRILRGLVGVDLRKTHAQHLIHSWVEQKCGRSEETLRFMDMSLGHVKSMPGDEKCYELL